MSRDSLAVPKSSLSLISFRELGRLIDWTLDEERPPVAATSRLTQLHSTDLVEPVAF